LYPGTGPIGETGSAAAAGANLNLPFPEGTAGDTFRAAFDEVIVPVIERFAPDWLIVSAGFDAHRDDPLAGLALSAADYADMASRLQPLVPPQRLLVVLEGGYDLGALTHGVGATLGALLDHPYRPEGVTVGTIGMDTVIAAKQLWDV
jgi:acetoin utilization deacetylase AcuC-like enzyme